MAVFYAVISEEVAEKLVSWSRGCPQSVSHRSALMHRLFFPHRYDLDCKSDNLSKHVSVPFTSAAQTASHALTEASHVSSSYNICLI